MEEDGSDEEDCDAAVAALLSDAWRDASSVVGFFAELDFQSNTRGSRSAQIRRLRTMIDASARSAAVGEHSGSIELRPPLSAMPGSDVADPDPYVDAVRELVKCMLERAGGENRDSGNGVAVHLSSWAGSCDNMIKLLGAFPNLMVGMNGAVSFSKATDLHACAFDVPLDRLLLETGSPLFVPSSVAESLGRDAINHSGLIPFVAEAVAQQKSSAPSGCSAVDVALACGRRAHVS